MMPNPDRVNTIPLCAGCREERAAAKAGRRVEGLALHDGRCACFVIVPTRPKYGEVHIHCGDEPRPWVTGARGGRYDKKPPASHSAARFRRVR